MVKKYWLGMSVPQWVSPLEDTPENMVKTYWLHTVSTQRGSYSLVPTVNSFRESHDSVVLQKGDDPVNLGNTNWLAAETGPMYLSD